MNNVFLRVDAPFRDTEWVDETEVCLGGHHLYVPIERCEHGLIDAHSWYGEWNDLKGYGGKRTCAGSPTLMYR